MSLFDEKMFTLDTRNEYDLARAKLSIWDKVSIQPNNGTAMEKSR